MTTRLETKPVLAALGSLFVWSSAFAGISVVVGPGGGYGAGQAALLRFLVASATMGVFAVATRMRMPARKDLARIALAAVFGITIYHLAFTFGETRVSAGASALIVASGPIWTALLAVAFLGERLKGWGWAGVMLAFSGVATIAFSAGKGGFALEPMALVVLVAAISTAIYFVLSKRSLRSYSSLEFTSYVIWIGTLPMLAFLPGLIRQLPLAPVSSTWTIVYLGVFPGALAYFLWSYALARMPASTTASFLYAQPVLATVVAWLWQGVVPNVVTLAGGAVALVGVILVQTKGRAPSAVAIAVATTPEQKAAVRALSEEVMAWLGQTLGLEPSYYADELAHFEEWYQTGCGRSFVATVDGSPVGSVVFRDFGDGAAELRRMYVRPGFRRRGIARALLAAAQAEAASLGYERMQFMTTPEFEGAIELYESEGFAPAPRYRPVASDLVVAYAKSL